MKCLECNKPTDNPKFCSRNCSATYNNRKYPKRAKDISKETFILVCEESTTMREATKKLSIAPSTFKRYAVKYGCYTPNQGLKGTLKPNKSNRKYKTEDILSGKHPHYCTGNVKKRIFYDGIFEKVCQECGNSEWQGKPITLELHHKDGNSTNHRLENLGILCPNCHAQTPNWKSKNKKPT